MINSYLATFKVFKNMVGPVHNEKITIERLCIENVFNVYKTFFLLSVTYNEFVTTEALIADKKIDHEHERKIEIYNILVYFNITNFHQDFAFSTYIS